MTERGRIEALTDSELALMRLFWRSEALNSEALKSGGPNSGGPLTAREIRDELYPSGTSSDHGTVQKLLQRLEVKKFVARDRSEFAHRFTATVSEQEYAGAEFQQLANKLTGGSFVPILTHLVETKGISRKELSELRRLFETRAGRK